MKYFILQANPETFEVEGYFNSHQYIYWTINMLHGNKYNHISKGDTVFFWRTMGKKKPHMSGFIAKGIVEEPPTKIKNILHPELLGINYWINGAENEKEDEKQVGIKLYEYRDESNLKRVLRESLIKDSTLKELNVVKGIQGRIFSVHDEIAKRIEDLWGEEECINEYEKILKDIKSVKDESDIPDTVKKQLIDARVGQGDFRKKVLEKYSKCPVVGVSLPALLRASHIKPWSKSSNRERLDPDNGIMLSTHVDVLFDKGFISFSDDGKILFKDEVDVSETIKLLAINTNVKIKINEGAKKYLKWHRDFFGFK